VGLHQGLLNERAWQVTPYARVLIPTETAFVHARRYGFDHGISALYRSNKWLSLNLGFSLAALFTENSGSVHVSYRDTLLFDAGFSPWEFLTLIAGSDVRLRAGDDNTFESFDPRIGLRLFPVSNFRLEFAAILPLWGADRTDLTCGINLGLSVLP
jgi:hypothetical protein